MELDGQTPQQLDSDFHPIHIDATSSQRDCECQNPRDSDHRFRFNALDQG
jgi:hypothetical protein